MAIQINTSKLLADYRQAKEELALGREINENDVRERMRPYLEKGVLDETDVGKIVDKLTADDQAGFERKWGTVESYIEDIPDITEKAQANDSVAPGEVKEEASPLFGVGYQN